MIGRLGKLQKMPSSTQPSHHVRALARIGKIVQQKYRIKRLLGTGGMAVVYAATHRNGHRVAIKYLLDHLVHVSDVARLFSREAYVANEVGHAGAVPVLDDDVDEEGCPFLIMPLLEGETLRARCAHAKGRLPIAEVCVLMLDVLDVLASAHAKGIVHRDIKPDNLFVTAAGNVRVLDFGIARSLECGLSSTLTGPVFGTPAFMPPEQARGERDTMGPHSDCWAVGATMFTALSGQYVHATGGAMGAQIIASATKPARSLAEVEPDLPLPIVQFVDRALAFDADERWRSAREMHDALLAIFEEVVGESVARGTARVRKTIVAALAPNREDIAAEATQAAERHRSWDSGDEPKAAMASATAKKDVPKISRARDILLAGVGVVALAGAVFGARYQRASMPALQDRAIAIDSQDANAWQVKAKVLMTLERYDEAISTLDTCLEIASGSTDCLYERIHVRRLLGQCSAAASDARRWVANAPASNRAYLELASSLAADGSFSETIDVALRQARNNDPAEDREATYAYYQASLLALNGDFEKAGARIQRTLEQLKETSALVGHARALAFSAEVSNEIGKGERAAKSAGQFFHQKGAWTEGLAVPLDHEPILLGVLLVQRETSREQWITSSGQWEHAALSVLTPRQAWAFRWGPASASRSLALEAWSQRPTDGSTVGSAGGIEQTTLIPALAKAFEGRIAVAAGEYAQAGAVLERAAKSCDSLEQPFVNTRAFLWLGEAKEAVADKHAACDAYSVVLQRWGHAKPRSVTAEAARRRSRALGCKIP